MYIYIYICIYMYIYMHILTYIHMYMTAHFTRGQASTGCPQVPPQPRYICIAHVAHMHQSFGPYT